MSTTLSAGRREPLRAHLALLVMVVIWAVNFSVAKIALEALSPLAFNALRFPLASLLVYAVLRRRGAIPAPPPAEWPRILALGLLGNFAYQMFFVFGLDHTTAGNASLLLAGTPIITALLSAFLGHERVRTVTWVGVVATFAGIALVITGGVRQEAAPQATLAGDALMVGASLTWAFYTVGSRPLVQRHGAIAVTAWTLWIGSVAIVLAGLADVTRIEWSRVPAGVWWAIAYAGVLSIGVAYMIWYYGVRQIGNTRTATYSNIVPVIALLVAWIWLREVPTLPQLVGAGIIIGGVSIAQSGPLARRRTHE